MRGTGRHGDVMPSLRLRQLPTRTVRTVSGAGSGTVVRDAYDSPVGVLRLVASPDGVHAVRFGAQTRPSRASGSVKGVGAAAARHHLATARNWLDAYFTGQPLPDPPALATDGTPLQQRVWAALDTVPPGVTIRYGELARRLRLPTAPVVAAVAANPVPVIRGSHRVYGWEGDTAGYRGGLHVKRWLELHEQAAYR